MAALRELRIRQSLPRKGRGFLSPPGHNTSRPAPLLPYYRGISLPSVERELAIATKALRIAANIAKLPIRSQY